MRMSVKFHVQMHVLLQNYKYTRGELQMDCMNLIGPSNGDLCL